MKTGGTCPYFSFGKDLADRMNARQKDLSNYIQRYNDWATLNNLKLIDPQEYESADELTKSKLLDEYAKRINKFVSVIERNKNIKNAETYEELRKAIGSNSAYSSYIVSKVLEPSDIVSFKNEFLHSIREIAKNANIDVETLISKRNIKVLFSQIKQMYAVSWFYYNNQLNNKANVERFKNLDLQVKEDKDFYDKYKDYENSKNYIERIIGIPVYNNGKFTFTGTSFFNELCITNMAEFKKVFGKGYNPDNESLFKSDDTDNIHIDEEGFFSLEENIRERWQVMLDGIDPSGSLSHIINDIISQTPRVNVNIKSKWKDGKLTYEKVYTVDNYTKGMIFKDSQGKISRVPIYCNERQEARMLMTLLNSSTSISSMMTKLRDNKKYENLYNILNGDKTLQTTFFQAFNKYHQTYYFTKNSNGKLSEINLNKSGKSDVVNSHLYAIQREGYEHSGNSIFRSAVKNETGLSMATFNSLKSYFNEKVGDDLSKFNESKDKNTIIEYLLGYFDIKMNEDTSSVILNDSITTTQFLNSVKSFINLIDIRGFKRDSFENMAVVKALLQKELNDSVNPIYINLKNILEVADLSNNFNKEITGMVSYSSNDGTKTLSTNIMMSHLTRLAKFFNNASSEDIKMMIQNTYSQDESFFDSKNKKYRVRWLEDLYNSADQTSGKSFKKLLSISRNLGLNRVPFENISDKGHMISLLSMYFNSLDNAKNTIHIDGSKMKNTGNLASDLRDAIYDQTGKSADTQSRYVIDNSIDTYTFGHGLRNVYKSSRSNKCVLPTFLTADTVALRGVTSLQYSEREIIDGMYDFFLMDIATCKKGVMLNSLGLPMSGNGKEVPLTKNPDKFGLLNFFNPDFVDIIKDKDGNIKEEKGYWNKRLADIGGVNALETDVKNLISEYFNNRSDRFVNKDLQELNIGDEIKIAENGYHDSIEENIKDFLMNYYFSLYNQIAITSVSPQFYKNAEDINKRNKGVLTNGMQLVADATDPNGKPLFEDPLNPTQKVVYVYDVNPLLSERDRKMLEKVFGTSEEAINYINDTYGNGSSITDGEGWRSFSSWRKIGLAFGDSVWTHEMEDAYNSIQQISKSIYKVENEIESLKASQKPFELKSGSLEENQKSFNNSKVSNDIEVKEKQLTSLIQQIEDLAVIFQPRKPMCDGLENYRGMVIPIQHKYAEIPIIPCLFPKNSAMRQLGEFMEQNDIDMICSDKCGKKGVFGEMDIQFKLNEFGQYVNKDGEVITGYDCFGNEVDNPTRGEQRRNKNFSKEVVENRDESLADVLDKQFWERNENGKAENSKDTRVVTPVIHDCSLSNYLIMNNVPDHTEALSLFGNQIRKQVISGINKDKSYSYKFGGKLNTISGKKLITLYNSLICANYFSSFSNFKKLLNDPSRLLKEMSNNILANDRCDISTIDKLVDGMPFWDKSLQHDVFATLISMLRNSVIKQKINGGSIVQASSLGTDMSLRYLNDDLGFETDENGYPTSCECVMPFSFSYKDTFGNTINLKYEDYCNADGTFKVDENGNTLIEKDFPGILDIVAYRIPTESEYSAFALHVKRCCPRSGRNYIQLPTITTIRAGFDFDIDKLYLMRKTFNSDQSDYKLKKVWDGIFAENTEFAEAMNKAIGVASRSEIDSILSKYSEAGLEEPKVEDIPINRFWDIAQKHSFIKEDKTKVFDAYVKQHPELIKSNTFEDLNLFDENGEIDYNNIFSTRSDSNKINNAILEIMLQRIKDPELSKDAFTAGGFSDTSNDAAFINAIKASEIDEVVDNNGIKEISLTKYYNDKTVKDIVGENTKYDFADPMTTIRFNQLNQVAAKLIGIYANDSANYNIFSNIDEMKITGVKPIIFGSLIGSDIEDKGSNLLVKESNGKTTKQRIAELLAASVDAVKDPVLNYLNLNTVTGEAATVLIRLGYDTKDVGLLFNQPIISECLSYMSRNDVSSITQAMNYVLKQHDMMSVKDITKHTNVDTRYLTREALAYNIASKNIDKDYFATSQSQVVRLFIDLMSVKDEFSSIVQQTRNTSSNVLKSTIGDFKARKQRIENYNDGEKLITIKISGINGIGITDLNMPMSTTEDRINFFNEIKESPFAFESVVYNIIDKAMEGMISDNTPYNIGLFRRIFANANVICNYGTPSSDFINSMAEEGANIILLKTDGDFNPNAVNKDKSINPNGYTNAELYLKHFDDFYTKIEDNYKMAMKKDETERTPEDDEAIDVFEFLKDSFVTNPKIIDRSSVFEMDSDGEIKEYTKLSLRPNYNLPKEYKNFIRNQWFSIVSNSNKDLRNFGIALFMHLYYSHGLNNSSNFDTSFVPSNIYKEVKADYDSETSYIDFMNDFISEDMSDNSINELTNNTNEIDVLIDWIKTHNDNKQFVYHVNDSVRSAFSMSDNNRKATVGISDRYLVTHTKDKVTYASPFILLDNKLYMLSYLRISHKLTSFESKPKQAIDYILVDEVRNDDLSMFINSDNKYLFGMFDIKEKSTASDEESYVEHEIENDERTSSEKSFEESIEETKNKKKGFCGED